jgi:hypothetical protein
MPTRKRSTLQETAQHEDAAAKNTMNPPGRASGGSQHSAARFCSSAGAASDSSAESDSRL